MYQGLKLPLVKEAWWLYLGHFWPLCSWVFWGSWSSNKNWVQLKIKPSCQVKLWYDKQKTFSILTFFYLRYITHIHFSRWIPLLHWWFCLWQQCLSSSHKERLRNAQPSATILRRSVPLNVPPIVKPLALLQQFVGLTPSTAHPHLAKYHLQPDAPAHKKEHQMNLFLTEKPVRLINNWLDTKY